MNFLQIMKIPRASFSIINKIRAKEKVKQPPIERKKTLPHQINDFVGNITSYEQKVMDLTPHQLYLI